MALAFRRFLLLQRDQYLSGPVQAKSLIRQKGGACHGAHRPAGRSYEEWGTAVDAGITSEGQGGPP